MAEKVEIQERILEELEELVSQLAQQTDSKTTNLQVYIEEQRKAVEEQDRKRWTWFLVIFTSVFLALGILNFEMWERQRDRVAVIEQKTIKIETDVEAFKNSVVKKYEFVQQMADHVQQARDANRDREERVKKLEKDVEKLKQGSK